jgi:hypothetical protein
VGLASTAAVPMLVTGVVCAFEIKEGWPDIRDIIEVNNKTRTCINYVLDTSVVNA